MNLTPEGETKARAEHTAEQAKNDAEMDACRYCKVARNRGKRGCQKHLNRRHLIYVTSPISESYWAN